MIEVKNLVQSYSKDGSVKNLDDVSLVVKERAITALIGANGAGKSTLLGAMSNIVDVISGEVSLDGIDIRKMKPKDVSKRIALLKQAHQLSIRITVKDLVEFGRFPHCGGRLKDIDNQKVKEAMDYMMIWEFKDRFLDQLSGGQRQRAFIAMILAQDTPYVFLDEPLNNLDIKYSVEMMKIVKKLVDDLGKTVVVVMHDINFAAAYADHVVAMCKGKILAEGHPDEMITREVLGPCFDHNFNITEHCGKRVCLLFD